MDILTNKKYKLYDNLSRYTTVPIFYNTIDKKYQSGFPTFINKNTQYVLHIIKAGDTLDNLAYYYYSNPTYFWIIADFNNIQDPFDTLIVGSTLNIPSFTSIELVN